MVVNRHYQLSQSRTGFPGHLARVTIAATQSRIWLSQSRTGFPGHLASLTDVFVASNSKSSQSRTGFPGHLAGMDYGSEQALPTVSIPNGLPRPFSQSYNLGDSLSNMAVSIPNGLPRPFSLSDRCFRSE